MLQYGRPQMTELLSSHMEEKDLKITLLSITWKRYKIYISFSVIEYSGDGQATQASDQSPGVMSEYVSCVSWTPGSMSDVTAVKCLLWSWSRATLVSSHDLWAAIREAVNSYSGRECRDAWKSGVANKVIISNELPHTKIFVIHTGYNTSIDIIPVECWENKNCDCKKPL